MDATLDRIKNDLDSLTLEQRAELAEYLDRSLNPPTGKGDDPEAAAWQAEIERRVQEIISGEEEGIPAEQVFAEMRAKYR